MMNEEIKLNSVIKFSRTSLWYLGCWPQKNQSFWNKFLYGIWAALAYTFISGFYVLIQAINTLVNLGNVEEMMGSLFLLLTNIVHSFKIFICIYRSPQFDEMINYGSKRKMQANSEKEFEIIRRYERATFVNLLVFVVLAFLCILGWLLVPILEDNITGERRMLPLPAWYPFNKILTPAYELAYSHQVVAITLAAYSNMSLDAMIANLMGLSSCELELLMYRLQNLARDQRTIETLQAIDSEQFDVLHLENERELEERLYRELCDCIFFHEEIYSMSRLLQTCISPVTFAQFSVSALIFCASLYQLAMQSGGDRSPIAAFATFFYLLCMLWELFLYCWNGNELLILSLKVAEAAGACNWCRCSKRFCAALRFLMMRSLRPIKMTAGTFIDLSLQTYVTIVKASYSFFTVIQNAK